MQQAVKTAEALCQGAGARFTEQRRQVFEIVWQGHKAMTAAEIMQALGNTHPPVTYRALEFLKEMGLVHHIASLNAYVGCLHASSEGHVGQMLICTQCRNVVELTAQKVTDALTRAAQELRFSPAQMHIEVLGVCASCQQGRASHA